MGVWVGGWVRGWVRAWWDAFVRACVRVGSQADGWACVDVWVCLIYFLLQFSMTRGGLAHCALQVVWQIFSSYYPTRT